MKSLSQRSGIPFLANHKFARPAVCLRLKMPPLDRNLHQEQQLLQPLFLHRRTIVLHHGIEMTATVLTMLHLFRLTLVHFAAQITSSHFDKSQVQFS